MSGLETPDVRHLVHQIFLDVFHRLAREYRITTRRRHQTHLEGTGCLYDNETSTRFFQVEQQYPFDAAEIRPGRDVSKLIKKIAGELRTEIFQKLGAFGLKEGDRLFILAADNVPPLFTEIPGPGDPLHGCVQVNARWIIALPDHLPFGLDGPKLIVPKSAEEQTRDMDIHAARDEAAKETDRLLKEAKEKTEDLFKIDLDK